MKKKKPEFKVSEDEKFNPELKKEIQDLRGLIFGNLPQITNPRFTYAKDSQHPRCHIMDTETGKICTVGLCDMHGAIKVLNALFGE